MAPGIPALSEDARAGDAAELLGVRLRARDSGLFPFAPAERAATEACEIDFDAIGDTMPAVALLLRRY